MHGPDGENYPNENRFTEIDAPHKVVIQHVSEPRFLLTIGLNVSPSGTHIVWSQVFEHAEFASRAAANIVPANEQNLDRLTQEVLCGVGGK